MDEIREAFEKWLLEGYPDNPDPEWRLKKFENGEYVSTSTVIQWDIWRAAIAWQKTQPPDPWVNAPKEPGAYRLQILNSGMWTIERYIQIPDLWIPMARGYNCDPSRDGETRVYNPETKQFEEVKA
jgi:hypothetical protein